MTPAQARARSSSRRTAGLCLGCGEVRVRPGTRCTDCRTTATAKRRDKAFRAAPRVTVGTLFAMVARIEAWESARAASATL